MDLYVEPEMDEELMNRVKPESTFKAKQVKSTSETADKADMQLTAGPYRLIMNCRCQQDPVDIRNDNPKR